MNYRIGTLKYFLLILPLRLILSAGSKFLRNLLKVGNFLDGDYLSNKTLSNGASFIDNISYLICWVSKLQNFSTRLVNEATRTHLYTF